MKYKNLAKGKNEKCGGQWNRSGKCASGLHCLKTLKPGPNWYKGHSVEGRCVKYKGEAPVYVPGIFYIQETRSKNNKPVQKCSGTFRVGLYRTSNPVRKSVRFLF